MLGRGTKLAMAGAVALLAAAVPAAAQKPVGPYDGSNPFNCELQDAGTGTEAGDPPLSLR